MNLSDGIFDWTLERKYRRKRGPKPRVEKEKKPVIVLYKLRIDRQLIDLIRQAEAAFPAFEATDIIRRCARWINRSSITERRLAMISSGYKPKGKRDTTIIARSCEKTPVECDKFRILLHAFLTKALSMPKPEPFVPSESGFTPMSESDFIKFAADQATQMQKNGEKSCINTTGIVIINGGAEE